MILKAAAAARAVVQRLKILYQRTRHLPKESVGKSHRHPFISSIKVVMKVTMLLFYSLDDSEDEGHPLYEGSSMSRAKFSLQFLEVATQFRISDVAADAMLQLFVKALPSPNTCPNFHDLKKACDVSEHWTEVSHHTGTFFMLNIQEQIKQIFSFHPELFHHNGDEDDLFDIRKSNAFSDFDTFDEKYVYSSLSIDDISPSFTSRHYNLCAVLEEFLSCCLKMMVRVSQTSFFSCVL